MWSHIINFIGFCGMKQTEKAKKLYEDDPNKKKDGASQRYDREQEKKRNAGRTGHRSLKI